MVPLIILFLVLVIVVFPLWAISRILLLGSTNESLARKLDSLEREMQRLRGQIAAGPKASERA
jgi:hypothetical protein